MLNKTELIVLATTPSHSNPDKHYEIRLGRKDNRVYCTCPAWKFSKAGNKDCKHLKIFRASNPKVVEATA
tara:strand:- start:169 stop:378 length:210 start_codon:yes stop_codon:yes gene_type:complete